MKKLFILACFLLSLAAMAQERDILAFTGAESIEEIDAATFHSLEELYHNPVRINSANRGRLLSCGLFSAYQAASLLDYIDSNGSILSISELALIDGFGRNFAYAAAPFISLESSSSVKKLAGSASMNLPKAKSKANLELGKLSAAFAAKGKQSSGHLTINGRHTSITAGDFNIRWGQGLTAWSGLTFSGAVKTGSFKKNATGISPAATWSSGTAFRGIAIQDTRGNMGRFVARSSLIIAESGTAGGNLEIILPSSQIGISAILKNDSGRAKGVTGMDCKVGIGKAELFAEATMQMDNVCIAALGGILWTPEYGKSAAILARHYPTSFEGTWSGAVRSASKVSDESGISAALAWLGFSLGADFSIHPSKGSKSVKGLLEWTREDDKHHFTPSIRLQLKYRSSDKYPLNMSGRAELGWKKSLGIWNFTTKGRIESVVCRKWSIMSYFEPAFESDNLGMVSRLTLYTAENWEDRIYCYQRDVPGSFNVPALYGRGYMISMYGYWKCHLHKNQHYPALLLYVRGCFNKGKASYSLQAAYRF